VNISKKFLALLALRSIRTKNFPFVPDLFFHELFCCEFKHHLLK